MKPSRWFGGNRRVRAARAITDAAVVQSHVNTITANVAQVEQGIAELDAFIDEEAAKPENAAYRERIAAAQAAGAPPPGWYPNPDGKGERLWNGLEWTPATR